jgi:hypothetical protein
VNHQRYSDDEMLDELRRVAALVDGPLSRPKFIAARPRISAPAITARFGSWLKAITLAELPPAYRFGGVWRRCPVCDEQFRFEGGVKARLTCGKKSCTGQLMSEKRSKGRAASKSAARGRAKRVIAADACERCGRDGSESRIERHHKDRDPYNNARENLEALCHDCHVAEHSAPMTC